VTKSIQESNRQKITSLNNALTNANETIEDLKKKISALESQVQEYHKLKKKIAESENK